MFSDESEEFFSNRELFEMFSDESEEFFSNRELFEMFSDEIESLLQDVDELKSDLQSTRKAVKKHHNLREQIGHIDERLSGVEDREKKSTGKFELLDSVKEYGIWIVAILSLLLHFIKVVGS